MSRLFATIPHSSLQIPPEATWLQGIPDKILKCDVDLYVDELYKEALTECSVPFFFFECHRYAVDANRFSQDVSPLTVQGVQDSSRSASDVHWHQTTKKESLIQKPLSQDLHKTLIEKYWNVFHQKIQNQFESFKKEGGEQIYLLDLHSMPSQGVDFHKDAGEKRVDVVLGTQSNSSAQKDFIDLVEKAYKDSGFKVRRDWPYQGGAITQTYGKPSQGQNVVQIELNRSLYMDEETKEKNKSFQDIQMRLKQAVLFICQNHKP